MLLPSKDSLKDAAARLSGGGSVDDDGEENRWGEPSSEAVEELEEEEEEALNTATSPYVPEKWKKENCLSNYILNIYPKLTIEFNYRHVDTTAQNNGT